MSAVFRNYFFINAAKFLSKIYFVRGYCLLSFFVNIFLRFDFSTYFYELPDIAEEGLFSIFVDCFPSLITKQSPAYTLFWVFTGFIDSSIEEGGTFEPKSMRGFEDFSWGGELGTFCVGWGGGGGGRTVGCDGGGGCGGRTVDLADCEGGGGGGRFGNGGGTIADLAGWVGGGGGGRLVGKVGVGKGFVETGGGGGRFGLGISDLELGAEKGGGGGGREDLAKLGVFKLKGGGGGGGGRLDFAAECPLGGGGGGGGRELPPPPRFCSNKALALLKFFSLPFGSYFSITTDSSGPFFCLKKAYSLALLESNPLEWTIC